MPTWTPDTIEGTQLDYGSRTRDVRGGLIEDMDVDCSGGSDFNILLRANAYLATLGIVRGSTLDGFPLMPLVRIFYRPLSHNCIQVQLIYETPDTQWGPAVPGEFVFRSESYSGTRTVDLVPGTREAILVDYNDAVNPANNVPEDIAPLNIYSPMWGISMSAMIEGNLIAPVGLVQSHVNSEPWPTGVPNLSPLPAAYWLIDRLSTEFSRVPNTTLVSAAVITRITEDWSEFGRLINRATGRVPFRQVDVDAIIDPSITYSHGIIMRGNGIIRVGPYPTIRFQDLFGF